MAEESIFLGGIMTLREMGFFDFFLPFLLFFAVIYAALDKVKVFGEGKKDINAIVALVIALITTTTAWAIKGIIGFLPWVGFSAIVIVAFLMLAAMIGGGTVEELFKNPIVVKGGIAVVAIVIFFAVFFSLGFDKYFAGTGGGSGKFLGMGEADIALIVIMAIGLIIFGIIMKSGGGSSSS